MKTTTEYREQFEALVDKAENEIKNNPKAYKKKLKRIAMLGYGLIFILLFLLVAVVGGTTVAAISSSAFLLLLLKKKLIFVVIGVAWVLFRSLFVKISEPEGLEMTREEYPELWKEVDHLHKKLKTEPIHRLILTSEMNASVSQTPRLGIIGPYKNTLVLGLELLISLSPEQAKSVLAHEFAHLSGSHGKFAAWIYRVRLTWMRIQTAFEENTAWGVGIIRKVIQWYTPYFTGYSFVIARDNEYEADSIAGKLTSNHTTASALVAVHVYSSITDEYFWKPLYNKSYNQQVPATDVYSQLNKFILNSNLSDGVKKRYIGKALKAKTDSADTHPALIDRLKALKAPGTLETINSNAATEWLSGKYHFIIDHFNQEWSYYNKDRWTAFYEEAEEARKEIKRIKSSLAQKDKDPWRDSNKEKSKNELWNLAYLTEAYCPDEDALSLYQYYYKKFPDEVSASHAVGRLLLQKDDEKGVEFIKKSLHSDTHKQDAAEELWQYYSRKEDKEQTAYWLKEAESAYDMYLAAVAEREGISSADNFIAPNIETSDEDLINEIIGESHMHKKVKSIWLAEKEMQYYKDTPLYIMCFETKGFVLDNDTLIEELAELTTGKHNLFILTKSMDKKIFKTVKALDVQIY